MFCTDSSGDFFHTFSCERVYSFLWSILHELKKFAILLFMSYSRHLSSCAVREIYFSPDMVTETSSLVATMRISSSVFSLVQPSHNPKWFAVESASSIRNCPRVPVLATEWHVTLTRLYITSDSMYFLSSDQVSRSYIAAVLPHPKVKIKVFLPRLCWFICTKKISIKPLLPNRPGL